MILNKEEFAAQILEHQQIIHKICRLYRNTKEDREDLFQEIVFQLWRSYGSFKGKSKLSTWIYRVGLNTAMASFRKTGIKTTDINESPQIAYESTSQKEENYDKLFWAISKLEDADKALIALYLENLSYTEMAEVLGISESNIGVRLNRVKSKIKKILNVE